MKYSVKKNNLDCCVGELSNGTDIAEVAGSNPVEAQIFFQASAFPLLKLENLLR